MPSSAWSDCSSRLRSTAGGSTRRRCSNSKGRVRRDHVTVQGRDEVHEEGSYFLEWWDAGRRKREPGGPDAFIAAEKGEAQASQARRYS